MNIEGSYRCVCKVGFTLNPDRVSCTATSQCTNRNCSITNGGCSEEKCFCNSGYQLLADNTCNKTVTDWCQYHICEQDCENTADGSAFTCNCMDGFILNDDKKTCRDNNTEQCSRTDCPTVNGGCANNICFCNNGFELSASNTCEAKDTDWCAIAGCDHRCEETEDGTSYVCSCNDGYILNVDKRTCRLKDQPSLPGPCSTADCEMDCEESADKSTFKCTCNEGYQLNNDQKTCRELRKVDVELTVDVALGLQASDLTNKSSPEYIALVQEVHLELKNKILPAGPGVTSIAVNNLRTGSLIIDFLIWIDDDVHPKVMNSLAAVLAALFNSRLTVQGQTGSVLAITVDGTALSILGTACSVYSIFMTCPECVINNQLPECRELDSDSGDQKTLELGLGLGLGLAVAVVCIAALVIFLLYKHNRSKVPVNPILHDNSAAQGFKSGPMEYFIRPDSSDSTRRCLAVGQWVSDADNGIQDIKDSKP